MDQLVLLIAKLSNFNRVDDDQSKGAAKGVRFFFDRLDSLVGIDFDSVKDEAIDLDIPFRIEDQFILTCRGWVPRWVLPSLATGPVWKESR